MYGSQPPDRDFQHRDVQAEIDALPARECLAEYRGEVTTESYTVMHSGEDPAVAHVACLMPQGQRTCVNTEDRDLMQAMTREEFCGREARIDGDGNLAIGA